MFCMKCGAELPNDAKFCFKCGARIEKEALNNNAEESVFQHKNQNTNVAAQKRTDNGSANWLILPLGKRKLRFPASMKKYCENYRFYMQLAERKHDEFLQEYQKLGVETIEDVLDKVEPFLFQKCAEVTNECFRRLLELNIRSCSVESYSKLAMSYYDPEQASKPYYAQASKIASLAQKLKSYRAIQRASRGKWVGGGFGLKGAIKGAAIAGGMNAADNVLHGITDTVTDVSDQMKIRKAITLPSRKETMDYFEGEFEKFIFALFRAETDILIYIGYLDNFDMRTASEDTRLQNSRSIVALNANKDMDVAINAVEEYLNAAIDCIQRNPCKQEYYEDIYQCGIILKRSDVGYANILEDLFKISELFKMTEDCEIGIKERSMSFLNPFVKQLADYPENVEEAYERLITAINHFKEGNPFFDDKEYKKHVEDIKNKIVAKWNEFTALEEFKKKFVKYYEMTLTGRIKELWNSALLNDAVAQYVLENYYRNDILYDAIRNNHPEIFKSVLKEISDLGKENDFGKFLIELLSGVMNVADGGDSRQMRDNLQLLADKPDACVSAIAYTGHYMVQRGNTQEGVLLLKKAADNFHPHAMAWYGKYLITGEKKIAVDEEKAHYYLNAATFASESCAVELNEKYKLKFSDGTAAYDDVYIKSDENCFMESYSTTKMMKFPLALISRYKARFACAVGCVYMSSEGGELPYNLDTDAARKSLLIPDGEKIYFVLVANVFGNSKKDMSGLIVGRKGIYVRETGIMKKRGMIPWDDFKSITIDVESGINVGKYHIIPPSVVEEVTKWFLDDLQTLCNAPLEKDIKQLSSTTNLDTETLNSKKTTPKIVVCPKCGNEVDPSDKFCAICGTEIKS